MATSSAPSAATATVMGTSGARKKAGFTAPDVPSRRYNRKMAGKFSKRRLGAAALLALLVAPVFLAGQSQPPPAPPTPTFKAQVEYVEVDVLVTDRTGGFIRDLKKDDFQVFEDGKRQSISNFSLVDIPLERADRPLFAERPIEPDVRSNERPFEGRVYAMILDDLHTAPLRSQRVKAAARQFIERNVSANDLMAVLYTGGRAQDAQEFTNNKRFLLASVDKFMGQKLDSPTITRNEQFFRQNDTGATGGIYDPDDQMRARNARSMLETLRKVSEWFGGIHGRRKTLLLFSEGIDYDITDIIRDGGAPPSSALDIITDIRDAISATTRSNVSIYTVDPRGLTTSGDDTIGVGQFADQVDTSSGIGVSSLNKDFRLSQDSLRSLADETGGFAALNQNDFTTAFDRIVRDNSSYYVLAYYPPSDKRDGKFHKIEVKVNRPGAVVRSRRGYNAPRGKVSQPNTGGLPVEIYEALNSPIQASGVTMRVFAAPFKGTAPNASVLVGLELLGKDLTLDANSRLDVSIMAIDSKGKASATRNDAMTMNLRPETRTRVEQSGFRLLNRLEVPPGRYQLRVAARDAVRANVGSVIYDLEVPDFFKQPFSVSGITLTSLGGGAMVTAKADEQLREVLPAPPVAQRTFRQNDELALFAEVYDNAGSTPHKVDIVTSVLTDEGRVLFKNEETRDSSELQGAKGGYGYTARVPLSGIAPGAYVLNIDARSRMGNEPGTVRQIQFEIVPAPQ
jgi:VWFA-related protein